MPAIRNNSQILLEEMLKQEREEHQENLSIDKFFEFYAASEILKTYEVGYDEIEAGLVGDALDGGVDGIYLLVNGDVICEDEDNKGKYKKNVDV